MDVVSIKKEIDRYVQISNDNKLLSNINNDNVVRMSPEEFLERTEQLDLIPAGYIESKVENIYKVNWNAFIVKTGKIHCTKYIFILNYNV